MSVYTNFESIMFKFFNNQMFHRPFDVILENAKKIKEKYKYPCKLQKTFIINNLKVLTHHYGIKYKKVLLYFPGGSFTDPPTILHYKYAKRISKKFKRHVIMFQYPLFPEVDPSVTTILIRKIIENMKITSFDLLGDSAGANLAIYLLKSLHQDKMNIVNKTILISPFVDCSMNNHNINIIKQHDFILDKDNCKKIGINVYSKYLNGNTYLFPLSNDFIYKNDVLVISGGHEIFSLDISSWAMSQKVIKVKHIVYKNMCHCFTLFPFPQARKANQNIKEFIDK